MRDFKQLFEKLQYKSNQLGISLNLPATKSELYDLESAINQKLPNGIYQFYRFCNGFETYDYLFRLIPIEEIIRYKHELETNQFVFAEYLTTVIRG